MSPEMDYRKRFGARLFRLRRAAGLPQHAVGEHVGVSHAAVQQWEIGKTAPTAGKRQRLAELFEESFDDAAILAEPLPVLKGASRPDGRSLPRASAVPPDVDQDKAKRLRQARESAGYKSAAEAASRLDVPYSTYAGHESGQRGFRRTETARYAEAFGVDAGWLEFGNPGPSMAAAESSVQKGGSALDRMRSNRDAVAKRVADLRAALAEAEREEQALCLAVQHLEAATSA